MPFPFIWMPFSNKEMGIYEIEREGQRESMYGSYRVSEPHEEDTSRRHQCGRAPSPRLAMQRSSLTLTCKFLRIILDQWFTTYSALFCFPMVAHLTFRLINSGWIPNVWGHNPARPIIRRVQDSGKAEKSGGSGGNSYLTLSPRL